MSDPHDRKQSMEYSFRNGQKLRKGFTTGICAAAAAKGAALMLLTGETMDEVDLCWRPLPQASAPSNRQYRHVFPLEQAEIRGDRAACGVRKDAGDDVDVTDGLLIFAEVWFSKGRYSGETLPRISIKGGEGIGRVTLPGLDQPVGSEAINSGPRYMIREAVRAAWIEWMDEDPDRAGRDAPEEILITLSAPGGEALAAGTFNPVLGIEGGISILGTTGIVDPMSGAAVEESVRADVRVKAAGSTAAVALTPGNTGAAFAEEKLGIAQNRIVLCSNYFGAAIDEACLQGVENILLIGAVGKVVKLAGGIFNTHSYEADARLDILIRCALQAGAGVDVLRAAERCVTTEAALQILRKAGLEKQTADRICRRALEYIGRRCGRRPDAPECQLILTGNDGRLLSASEGALRMAAGMAAADE